MLGQKIESVVVRDRRLRWPVPDGIEEQLKGMLDIPVFHDDQHGTAVVVLASLINVCRYTGLQIRDASVGIIGLGAAGAGAGAGLGALFTALTAPPREGAGAAATSRQRTTERITMLRVEAKGEAGRSVYLFIIPS